MVQPAPRPISPLTDLRVNGRIEHLAVDGAVPLLTVLRNDLGYNGPKYGCGLGQCGACMIPLAGVAGREVTTLEGLGRLAGLCTSADELHPVQKAFIATQAAQCGYCLNGMIIATVALLRLHPRPTEAQARSALSHNLCRCGSHLEILAAVQLAAQWLAEPVPAPDPAL